MKVKAALPDWLAKRDVIQGLPVKIILGYSHGSEAQRRLPGFLYFCCLLLLWYQDPLLSCEVFISPVAVDWCLLTVHSWLLPPKNFLQLKEAVLLSITPSLGKQATFNNWSTKDYNSGPPYLCRNISVGLSQLRSFLWDHLRPLLQRHPSATPAPGQSCFPLFVTGVSESIPQETICMQISILVLISQETNGRHFMLGVVLRNRL